MTDVEQELDEMLDTLDIKSDEIDDSEEEQESKEVEETAEEEAVETEEVAEVDEGIEEEEEVEEVVDELEEEVEETPDELAELRTQNEALLERLESVTAAAPTAPDVEPEVVDEIKGYLDGLDIDDVVSTPEKLESVLKEVERRTKVSTTEAVLKAIPQLVITQIQQQTVLRDAVNEFYEDNPDLASVKRTVGAVATDIQAENPDWTMEQIFKETAPRARKLLGMKEGATKTTKRRRPALVKPIKSSKKPTAPKLSDLEEDIAGTLGL